MTIDWMGRMAAAAPLILLAACDSGGVVDQTVRIGVRQSAIEACSAWIPQSEIALAAGVETARLCGCAADRILEGRSASELANLRPSIADLRAAVAHCVSEMRSPRRDPQ
jgi:hypothetical protein